MTKFVPGGFPRFKHQKVALKTLIKNDGVGALLYEPGLGKTACAIDYACVLALKSKKRHVKVIVIAPLVAVDTWVKQMSIFASEDVTYWAEVLSGDLKQRAEALASRGGKPFKRQISKGKSIQGAHTAYTYHWKRSLDFDSRPLIDPSRGVHTMPKDKPLVQVEVLNTDTFKSRSRVGSKGMADIQLEAVKRYDPDLVVLDEMHLIKSPSSNLSRFMDRLGAIVPRRLGLTGTVMPHSPLDIYGQWRFIDPYAFGNIKADGTREKANFTQFKATYAQMGGYMGYEVKGYKNLDKLQEVMSHRAIVAKKDDALDLPKTTDIEIPVDLTPQEKKAYNDMKKELGTLLSSGETATATTMLVRGLRLRQITAGHLKNDNDEVVSLGDSKAKTIASLVHDTLAGETRIVIFGVFTHEIQTIAKHVQAKGTEVQVITGATPVEERKRLRSRFGSKDPRRMVMVAQVSTMSLAVNELVTASHAIYASLTQKRDDYIQSRDRLNRMGQTKPVTFWHAIAPGTIDSVILETHRNNTALESRILQHIKDGDDL